MEKTTYVDHSVLQHGSANAVMVDRRLCRTRWSTTGAVLKIPAHSLLVVREARCVVAFVEILQHGGEDLRLFGRKVDAFA